MPVVSYEVYDVEGERLGQIVEARPDYIVVEHGVVFKSHRAVPRTLADIDHERRAIRLQVSREVVQESPILGTDIDSEAVDAYYAEAAKAKLDEKDEARRLERDLERDPERHGALT